MNNNYDDDIIEIIKSKFQNTDLPERIPLQRGRFFGAKLVSGGIVVDNLGNQNFLPWKVFEEVIDLLRLKGGSAKRGDAMNSKLGDNDLPLDSIEGHIAYLIYNKKIGDSVLRRISPISGILVWAGICDIKSGELTLI